VHLLAFALLVGAPESLGGFAGKLVNVLQREVERDIFQLAALNVVFLELG
jgi:hypothetical protein